MNTPLHDQLRMLADRWKAEADSEVAISSVILRSCAKRGCGKANQPWLTFESGWPNRIRHWCLDHIPWHVRLRMWMRGDRDD